LWLFQSRFAAVIGTSAWMAAAVSRQPAQRGSIFGSTRPNLNVRAGGQ
jgi:hypothetical protein